MMKIIKKIIDYFHIFKEYRPMLGVKYSLMFIIYEILGIEKLIKIKVCHSEIYVRTNSPDVKVTQRTLYNSEFSDIKYVDPNTIIDVGAYIGTSSIYFSKKYPNALIYAIEPEKNNYELLLKNIEGFAKIIPINSAIWGLNEEREIFNRFTGHWGYTVSETFNKSESTNQFVKCLTISDIIRKYKISTIDILKLDAEGSEKSILNNSKAWIDKVNIISAELHDSIVLGCDRAFYLATKDFSHFEKKGEKITAYR